MGRVSLPGDVIAIGEAHRSVKVASKDGAVDSLAWEGDPWQLDERQKRRGNLLARLPVTALEREDGFQDDDVRGADQKLPTFDPLKNGARFRRTNGIVLAGMDEGKRQRCSRLRPVINDRSRRTKPAKAG